MEKDTVKEIIEMVQTACDDYAAVGAHEFAFGTVEDVLEVLRAYTRCRARACRARLEGHIGRAEEYERAADAAAVALAADDTASAVAYLHSTGLQVKLA
jgi:hypothetical protein